MKIMTDLARSVAANASTANVLDGKPEVYLSRPSALSFYITADVVGLFVTILVGDSVVIQDQEVGNQNRYPVIPDDFLADSGGAPGDLLFIAFRNSTVGAIVVNTLVQVARVG